MSHILAKNTPDDEIPGAPGHWQIRLVQEGGVSAPHLFFHCPLRDGLCGVPIKPAPPNGAGCSWTWDGNVDRPSLTPSINCVTERDGKPTGGCGWHGFLTNGELTP